MRKKIRNAILGSPEVDEKVTTLTKDEDESEEQDKTEDAEGGEGVVDGISSSQDGTPSMSEAAGESLLDQDPVEPDGQETEVNSDSSSGVDREKIEEFENQPSSLENKNAANFLIPTTTPIGRGQMEIGYAKVSGTGAVEIPYESDFNGSPSLVITNFGYISFSIPTWFGWSYDLDIRFWDNSFDFDFDLNIDWTTIRLPSFAFLWSVDSDQFEIFNAWGETWVTYIAMER